MLKLHNLFIKSDDVLIKSRLAVYLLTLTHLLLVSVYLLKIDFSKSKDPQVQVYVKLKWRLITTWFNLLNVPYLLLSIYCDWNLLKRQRQTRNTRLVYRSRDFLFNSLILPITVFGDILFWRLYNKDRRLLMPTSIDDYISIWNNHSMHTVSLVFVMFDLICMPRKRPKDLTPEIITLMSFITVYLSVCIHSLINGDYVYPGLKAFSAWKLLICGLYVYIANLFYYTGQWFIVDIVWTQRRGKEKITDYS